jgi:hypothetical protein
LKRVLKSEIEPNRTRNNFTKVELNQTELDPEKPGSIRSLVPMIIFINSKSSKT